MEFLRRVVSPIWETVNVFGEPCPCGSGEAYASCCGPLHRGVREAETAVELMRSRYAAFATGEVDYLFRTWHPRTRPHDLAPDGTAWARLEIHDFGDDWVDFTAHFDTWDGPGSFRERSRFERRAGRWVYVDGEISA